MTNVVCRDCQRKFPGPDALQRHKDQGDCDADTPEGFEWEPPPVGGRKQTDPSAGALIMLQRRPNVWARIMVLDTKQRGGTLARRWNDDARFCDEYEFKGGKYMDTGSAVWARFIPPKDRV